MFGFLGILNPCGGNLELVRSDFFLNFGFYMLLGAGI